MQVLFRIVRDVDRFQAEPHKISAALDLGVPERPTKSSMIIPTIDHSRDRLSGTNHIVVSSNLLYCVQTWSELTYRRHCSFLTGKSLALLYHLASSRCSVNSAQEIGSNNK
jgi:hypothetical protein